MLKIKEIMDSQEQFTRVIEQYKQLEIPEAFRCFDQLIPTLSDYEFHSLLSIYSIEEFLKYFFLYLSKENVEKAIKLCNLPTEAYFEVFFNYNDPDLLKVTFNKIERYLTEKVIVLTEEDLDYLEARVDNFLKNLSDGNDLQQVVCWELFKNFLSRTRQLQKPSWIIEDPAGPEPLVEKSPLAPLDSDCHDCMRENNVELFRRYGPINRKIASDCSVTEEDRQTDNCLRYGCRMFYCFEFPDPDYDECYEYSLDDINYCQACGKKIENNRWALREPLSAGGWGSWFCTEKCLKRLARDKDRVKLMFRLLSRYGIYNSV